ncbi:MAG: hypothetical protein E7379_00665 [Clostridiales bacterium]|nr:hypothetical protein [Clostridiales bacterium]
MNQKAKQQFEKHFKRLCKDKYLVGCASLFFDRLASCYEDVIFSKADFEKLIIDGKEIEQDVVNDLLTENETVSAEEIFSYLFINNIKKINVADKKLGENSGAVDFSRKILAIKRFSPKLFYREPVAGSFLKPANISEEAWAKQLKILRKAEAKRLKIAKNQAIERANDDMLKAMEGILYHELAHVFELKIFANGSFAKNDATDRVFIKTDKNKYVVKKCSNLTREDIENAREKQKKSDIEGAFNILKTRGATAISEIFNERFACKITKRYELSNDDYVVGAKFYQKQTMLGNCVYNIDNDIASLISLLVNEDEKSWRFNSQILTNKLKNLKISQEKFEEIKAEFFKSLSLIYPFNMMIKRDGGLDTSYIQDTYSLLTGIIGGAKCVTEEKDVEKIKILAQELLIEGIKNEISECLTGQDFENNKQLYKKVDDAMLIIDNVLLYPEAKKGFYDKGFDSLHLQKESIDLAKVYSVEKYAEEYGYLGHIKAFDGLIKKVKSAIGKSEEKFKFFAKQKQLNLKYSELQTKEELALLDKQMAEEERRKDILRKIEQEKLLSAQEDDIW